MSAIDKEIHESKPPVAVSAGIEVREFDTPGDSIVWYPLSNPLIQNNHHFLHYYHEVLVECLTSCCCPGNICRPGSGYHCGTRCFSVHEELGMGSYCLASPCWCRLHYRLKLGCFDHCRSLEAILRGFHHLNFFHPYSHYLGIRLLGAHLDERVCSYCSPSFCS